LPLSVLSSQESNDSRSFIIRSTREIKLYSVATPRLVPLIESGDSTEALERAIETITDERAKHPFDTVILGCTHYTRLKEDLRAHFNQSLTILSQDEIIPHKLAYYIREHTEIESRLGQGSTRSILLTLHRPDYDQIIQELLGGVML